MKELFQLMQSLTPRQVVLVMFVVFIPLAIYAARVWGKSNAVEQEVKRKSTFDEQDMY